MSEFLPLFSASISMKSKFQIVQKYILVVWERETFLKENIRQVIFFVDMWNTKKLKFCMKLEGNEEG